MNKFEFVGAVANEANCTKVDAERAVNAFIKVIGSALKNGEKVTLTGFGSFSSSKRESYTGRNPQTGESLQIPAKVVAKFTPGTELKAIIQ